MDPPAIHPLQVGDKVLVMDESNRRGDWVIGEVAKVLPSSNGVVRKAIVRAGRSELTRPVIKLCFISGDRG